MHQLAYNKKIPSLQSVHSILLLDGKYVLQLRDDKPGIAARGQWALFGGMLGKGETPLKSIKREIFEELRIKPNKFQYLWFVEYIAELEKKKIRSWFFVADVEKVWGRHKLMEGQDVGMFSYEQTKELNMVLVVRKTIARFQKEVILK